MTSTVVRRGTATKNDDRSTNHLPGATETLDWNCGYKLNS